MGTEPGQHLQEEPQSERGPKGSRDTGADAAGGGPADRPAGSFEQEEMQTGGADDASAGTGGGESVPPGDAEPAVPPYEGRTTSTAEGRPEHDEHVDTSQPLAPNPEETPRGATASPADEQPADQAPQTEESARGTGPAHQSGVTRAEDQQ
ncbi:hypothetical protein ACWDUD_04375 [Rhodococcus sp. NPDC003382]|uniref:hypothetical protein n=1 Tax=Rhodococcus sp. CX TaxID=2789880 RepID=UPI0018CF9D1B|nr:hypothetical protein [Rhodococcus sp. CX]MBH0120130.1 hypothetical protein [Rhodococcus sp. CX]